MATEHRAVEISVNSFLSLFYRHKILLALLNVVTASMKCTLTGSAEVTSTIDLVETLKQGSRFQASGKATPV